MLHATGIGIGNSGADTQKVGQETTQHRMTTPDLTSRPPPGLGQLDPTVTFMPHQPPGRKRRHRCDHRWTTDSHPACQLLDPNQPSRRLDRQNRFQVIFGTLTQ